ncbi:hypothetical protein D3C75_265590 [compost metagenome]
MVRSVELARRLERGRRSGWLVLQYGQSRQISRRGDDGLERSAPDFDISVRQYIRRIPDGFPVRGRLRLDPGKKMVRHSDSRLYASSDYCIAAPDVVPWRFGYAASGICSTAAFPKAVSANSVDYSSYCSCCSVAGCYKQSYVYRRAPRGSSRCSCGG